LKRLSDLELQRDRLTYDESSRESRDGIFRSRQLLKFAERAFIDAGLLEIDDDAGLDQEEQYATAYDAVRSGESVGSMVSSHLAASRMEMSEDERSAEARPTDPANLPDLATQLTLEEMITSRLAAAE
jgi:D-serine dehydratase